MRHRVIIIDDNEAIHADFRKILEQERDGRDELLAVERALFGEEIAPAPARPMFEIDTALQGQEGVACVQESLEEGRPYALAFVDMRMPPGWDGLETIEHLWETDPDVQVVICSAHSDYDWMDVVERLGHSDKLLILKKPFEPIEVLQCASALSRKWQQRARAAGRTSSPWNRSSPSAPTLGSRQPAAASSGDPRCTHWAAQQSAPG